MSTDRRMQPPFGRGIDGSRQGKPGKGEICAVSGNSSMESRGFDSHPARTSHPPEASLAWGVVARS